MLLETPSLVSTAKWAVGIRTDTINFRRNSFRAAWEWKCEFMCAIFIACYIPEAIKLLRSLLHGIRVGGDSGYKRTVTCKS